MLARENVSYRVLENHPQDSRIKIKDDGIFQTMGARGGKNTNLIRLWFWRKQKWNQL